MITAELKRAVDSRLVNGASEMFRDCCASALERLSMALATTALITISNDATIADADAVKREIRPMLDSMLAKFEGFALTKATEQMKGDQSL